MSSSQRPARRHLATSPFKPDAEVVVEQYEPGDLVSHDAHGVGSVVSVDAHSAIVKFGDKNLRVASPFAKMEKL